MPVFNPGEPVFDQQRGEPVIDPRTGDFVEVEPNGIYTNALTNQAHDADDVANAAYFRAQTRLGEAARDSTVGVDYINQVFAGGIGIDVAIGEVADAIRTTPGVQAVTGIRAVEFNTGDRSLSLEYVLTKKSGERTASSARITG